MKKNLLLLFNILFLAHPHLLKAQSHPAIYIAPTDSLVEKKLAWWKDLKFGLLMHWGAYCEWGVVESWSICPEDEAWTQRKGPYSDNYFAYKKAYENLPKIFNPLEFNPNKWAEAAQKAGMRYMIFTTKHHDGFCMFDTKQTNYKVTATDVPFHNHSNANITKAVFHAFRKAGLGIGAYFSKADWHSPDYWWPYFPPIDRYPNYNEAKYPKRWKNFREFTYNQIQELMGGEYGKIDILWLDAGWVRPHSPEAIAKNPRVNDALNIPKIAQMARSFQPGLIVVDRDVPGPYENYLTPEQQVPPKTLDYPWETCMTMGNSWSYVPGDHYKPARLLIDLLIKIVARGGNFLLNIGPGPDGDWDPVAYSRLKEMGNWMKVNRSAIYGTHPIQPGQSGKIFFTASRDSTHVFAFYLADSAENKPPAVITINNFVPKQGSVINLLGEPMALKWEKQNQGINVFIPVKIQQHPPCAYAWTLRMEP
ncbi:MAG: alpha-L-fucosidase [Chitinophagaceae bacterium]